MNATVSLRRSQCLKDRVVHTYNHAYKTQHMPQSSVGVGGTSYDCSHKSLIQSLPSREDIVTSDAHIPSSLRTNDYNVEVHIDSPQQVHLPLSNPIDPRSLADSTTAKVPDPPTGWTADREEMDSFYYPDENDSLKNMLESCYGIPDVQPLCSRLPDSGLDMFLFRSRSKYYVWDGIGNILCSIEEPRELKDIYARISKWNGRLGGLTTEAIGWYPGWSEDDNEEGGVKIHML